jgi:hypothetical protein
MMGENARGFMKVNYLAVLACSLANFLQGEQFRDFVGGHGAGFWTQTH